MRSVFRAFTLLIVLSGCGFLACFPISQRPAPHAEGGFLDLSTWNLHHDGSLPLDGEWEFYWQKLMAPRDFASNRTPLSPVMFNMPGTWEGFILKGSPLPVFGFASFRLRIRLEPGIKTFALKIPNIETAYLLWVDGRQVIEVGKVARAKQAMRPQYSRPVPLYLDREAETVEIVLQIANFQALRGGMWSSILLGAPDQISANHSRRVAVDMFIFGVLLLISLYHFGLFIQRRKERSTLIFGAMCLLFSIRPLIFNERFLISLFPTMNWQFAHKVGFLTYYLGMMLACMFLYAIFPKDFPRVVMRAIQCFFGLLCLIVVATPGEVFFHTLTLAQIITLICIAYYIYVLVLALKRRRQGSWMTALGIFILLFTVVIDVLIEKRIIHSTLFSYANFGFLGLIFSQSAMLSLKFSKALDTAETLSESLEQKVRERTNELNEANSKLTAANLKQSEVNTQLSAVIVKLNETNDELSNVNQKLHEANIKLTDLDRAKTEFFANISHEFRTPLTLILCPLDSLIQGEYGDTIAKENKIFESMQHAGAKLLQLINKLLDLTKIEEGHFRLQILKGELGKMVKEIVDYARPLAARKGIELIFEDDGRGGEEDYSLYFDTSQLERAIVNLVSNALKFTDRGGHVKVRLEASKTDVRLAVSDTGCGIPAEKHDDIFKRFIQLDGSVTRRYGGTGIGLAFAREIVELHGGRITLKSAPGEGSTFTICLPKGKDHFPKNFIEELPQAAREGKEERETEPREWTQELLEQNKIRFVDIEDVTEQRRVQRAGGAAKGTRILVVDDNVHVLKYINVQLQDLYDVYVAENGREALEIVHHERPDVVISDYMMPEMDGLSMVQKLRDDPNTANIPVIMLSAREATQDRTLARTRGVDIYLAKPFSPRELRSAIEQLLAKQGRQVMSLIHAQKRNLEVLSGGIAHEIKNPLSYIRNAVFMIDETVRNLAERAKDDKNTGNGAKQIEKALGRIVRMKEICDKGVWRIEQVVQLLHTYAREGFPSEMTTLDFDSAVQSVLSMIAPQDGRTIEISSNLGAHEAKVLCLPHEMNQAITNIVQNAIDAAQCSVQVKTTVDDRRLVLEVSDDGPGIEKEMLSRIFTPFFTTKEPGRGMGLGLPLAQHVIHQAGGSIAIDSTPQKGATVKVFLPIQ